MENDGFNTPEEWENRLNEGGFMNDHSKIPDELDNHHKEFTWNLVAAQNELFAAYLFPKEYIKHKEKEQA